MIDRFRRDGFIAFREFIVGKELAELTERVERFIREIVPTLPDDQVFYEDKTDPTSLKQIQHMGDHDAWFGDFFENGRCRSLAEDLLGSAVVPKNMQYFNKPARIKNVQRSHATPAHQDGYYFMINPCEAVTMWLALDKADESNGFVRYVVGSHKLPMREHSRTNTLGFSQGITNFPTEQDTSNEIALTTDPGDLLVHDATTIHRADANQSDRPRRAMGLIYYSERAVENASARAAYQAKLTDELRDAGKL